VAKKGEVERISYLGGTKKKKRFRRNRRGSGLRVKSYARDIYQGKKKEGPSHLGGVDLKEKGKEITSSYKAGSDADRVILNATEGGKTKDLTEGGEGRGFREVSERPNAPLWELICT